VSLLPILWAMKTAPVVDAEERVILMPLGESAWSDGTDAFPSKKTIADIAKIDPKTVQRRLKAMTERGLISKGNQAAAAYIPEHFRPQVYDLMIPYSWFPDITQVNADRKAKGKPPLTPMERPDLSEAPPRKQRADKGRRRKPETDGGTTSPPVGTQSP
jgi:DNA-binding transcriptional MocR family regulator